MKKNQIVFIFIFFTISLFAQENWNTLIDVKLPEVISSHRTFVSIPNVPTDIQKMYKNVAWVKEQYKKVGFQLKTKRKPKETKGKPSFSMKSIRKQMKANIFNEKPNENQYFE